MAVRAFRGDIRSGPYMDVRPLTLSSVWEPDSGSFLAVNTISAPPIAIVDDDDSVRDSLRVLLESCGYEVLDYPGAVEFLEKGPVQAGCLILDMHMPGMNGLELVEILRERGAPVPIIMLSANAADLKRHPASASVFHVLNKPASETELLGWIETALARKP